MPRVANSGVEGAGVVADDVELGGLAFDGWRNFAFGDLDHQADGSALQAAPGDAVGAFP